MENGMNGMSGMSGMSGMNGSLSELLVTNMAAKAYFDSLHPSVRDIVMGMDITSEDELAAVANTAMSEQLVGIAGIYDDSDTWPD